MACNAVSNILGSKEENPDGITSTSPKNFILDCGTDSCLAAGTFGFTSLDSVAFEAHGKPLRRRLFRL